MAIDLFDRAISLSWSRVRSRMRPSPGARSSSDEPPLLGVVARGWPRGGRVRSRHAGVGRGRQAVFGRPVSGRTPRVALEVMPTPSPPSSAAAGAPSASPSSVPSYHDEVDPARYDDMLAAKVARLRDRFASLLRRGDLEVEPEVFPSPPEHFRSRCRFAVARGGARSRGPRPRHRRRHRHPPPFPDPPFRLYRVFDAGVPTGPIERFPALESIDLAMSAVSDAVAETPQGTRRRSRGRQFPRRGARGCAGPPLLTTHRRRVARGAGAARERLRAALLPALAFADAPFGQTRRTPGRDAATTRIELARVERAGAK